MQSPIDIARHYYVDDLPSALIPSTRLETILKQLQSGSQITKFSCDFLKQKSLDALFLLAIGELDYNGFKDFAVTERSASVKTAPCTILSNVGLTHE